MFRDTALAIATIAVAGTVACGSSPLTPNQRVTNASIVGTTVTDAFYGTDPSFELRVAPFDAHGTTVLDDSLTFRTTIASPVGVTARVVDKQCIQNRVRQPLALGMVIDTSSSMEANDPSDATGIAPGRKRVVAALVGLMQPGDLGLLTDFHGSDTNPLRDLVCVAAGGSTPPPCVATAESLTGDTAVLKNAASAIENYFGTPLYRACLQMVGIVGPLSDRRKPMVVVSDGLPEDQTERATCLAAARSNNVSIFAVGFGTDKSGIAAMRDLAESTGGSYTPANDAAQLGTVFNQMSYSDGYCTVTIQLVSPTPIGPGTLVSGEIAVGQGGSTTFEFLAPPRS
jgi:hypothetical protein